jgi:transcriptional regulator with XRE-family HTH domain
MSLGVVAAANVRAERARRKWRQKDLADRLGWSVDTLSNLETGQRRVTLDDLVALCRAFEITLDRLLLGADPADLATIGLRP